MRDHPSIYKNITSLNDLSQLLETNEDLITISQNSDNYYHPNPIIKGSTRQTYTVLLPLKEIQQKIFKKILVRVPFPSYLYGGIAGTDYIKNANFHLNSRHVINEDILQFFNNIEGKHIYSVWNGFFKFPHLVAEILTRLTVFKNKLPQGAQTSTHLSNLVFWNCEPDLVNDFVHRGFKYSRYIDDITISSEIGFSIEDKKYIIDQVYSMMFSYGFKPKRKKHLISSGNKPTSVHNLNLTSGKATVPQKKRKILRASIYQLEKDVDVGINSDEFQKRIKSVEGKIQCLRRLHPTQADKYLIKLNQIKSNFLQKHTIVEGNN